MSQTHISTQIVTADRYQQHRTRRGALQSRKSTMPSGLESTTFAVSPYKGSTATGAQRSMDLGGVAGD